jgi:hypothetical protein
MTNTPSFYSPTASIERSEDSLRAYLAYLQQRNGALEGEAAFAHREAGMARFDGPLYPSRIHIEPQRFNRNYAKFRERDVSEEELALMAFVKINAGEAYGVEKTREIRKDLWSGTETCDRIERAVLTEEDYHTRLLVGATRHFEGLSLGDGWTPPWTLALLIGGLARVPRALFHPVLLGAEVSGLYSFNWLLGRLSSLFPDEPQLREAMEERLIEVMVDEIGHVAFNRILVGEIGRRVGAAVAALVTQSHRVMSRELVALGFDNSAMLALADFDYGHLPQTVRDRGFFV